MLRPYAPVFVVGSFGGVTPLVGVHTWGKKDIEKAAAETESPACIARASFCYGPRASSFRAPFSLDE